ncbi:MAG: cytochrome d ubiquinol oxidase subunit II [Campylobacterota bacterium]|nr:cytochrome d ubiquinol oxidase subunit II [Campylobacterota bacterium]
MGIENLELLTLQQIWWIIVSLLGALFVLMMFIQGGQTLFNTLSSNETEKSMLVNSMGRKWELGFTTLVLFGGALFAAFPLFYATSFGGAYWVWMAILFCFVLQAVSYEFRLKKNNFLGQKSYEMFLYINGSVGVFLIGVALSTLFSGSGFMLDDNNFSHWISPYRGLEALSNPFNFLLGFALLFLAKLGGAFYFMSSVESDEITKKALASIKVNTILFLLFFLAFLGWILTKDGFAIDANGVIFMQEYKYLRNFIELPILLVMLVVGVVMVLLTLSVTLKKEKMCCIKIGAFGVVFSVMSILLSVGLNSTAFYPSTYDLQSSLTIMKSSGSHYTLSVMSYAALMVPFVLAYIVYAWRSLDKSKITQEEINKDKHGY